MPLNGWLQIAIILATTLLAAVPLGIFMAKVYAGKRTFLSPVLRPVERGFHALAGVDPAREQGWRAYAFSMLLFNAAGFLLLYVILRLQGFLPLNPQGFGALSPDLAFNTAVSFVTNTNWQSYRGETTMSHFSQLMELTVQTSASQKQPATPPTSSRSQPGAWSRSVPR